MEIIEAKYEVIRFIEHGMRCRPSMDRTTGELLIYRVRDHPYISKEQLFAWFRQLLEQLIQYHRCHDNQNYRYLNPYSVLVARDGKLLLLDLDAESNEFVLRNLQKRAMRAHFVKPVAHLTEGTGELLDLHGYGKTIQFILANLNIEPSLTRFQANKLEKVINKCLNESTGKSYKELKQLEKDLPAVKENAGWKVKKEILLAAATALSILTASCSCIFSIRLNQQQKYMKNWMWKMEQQWENDDELLGQEEIEELVSGVQTEVKEEMEIVQESIKSVSEQLNEHLKEEETAGQSEENTELTEDTIQNEVIPEEDTQTVEAGISSEE